jgi:uncharacterized membrane protein
MSNKKLKFARSVAVYLSMFLLALLSVPSMTFATSTQEPEQTAVEDVVPKVDLVLDTHQLVKAKVVEVQSRESKLIPGTNIDAVHQTLKIEILEGTMKGQSVVVENDRFELKEDGVFYLQITSYPDGQVTYAVAEPYRIDKVLMFVLLFIVLAVVFGGKQGIRGLLALGGSFFVLFYIFLPELLSGGSPVFLSLAVSSLIIIIGSYITHGLNKTTTSAVIGMILTILFTGFMAMYAVSVTKLTGFFSEDVVYLHFNTDGKIDMAGLLLGGILIGLLGVLYDAAIGQAVAIEELTTHAPHLSRRKLFERAMRIGREHIGALIDSLALAYVGASLPLLLLFYSANTTSLISVLNREDFSTEIIRIIIGSIGLILTVPITSFVSVMMLKGKGSEGKGGSGDMHVHGEDCDEEGEIGHSKLCGCMRKGLVDGE